MTDEQLRIPEPDDDEPDLGPAESAAKPETESDDYDPETGRGIPY